LMVFETLPVDTLPDIFFENNLSFPIDENGNHLSNGDANDVSQDIAALIPGVIDTGFFNCFSFGNGVESYKIRDSIVGRAFNLGERVTSVSAQDYKEASRYADITYSGVYNQETNVNKLNEFNLGLANFSNLETSFGDIQILDGRETDVLVLQEDKISYVLAGKNLLSDAAAGGAITSIPEVLGTQLARVEKYGISFNPESYVHWGYDRFFTDVKRGAVIQLRGDSVSQDQLIIVSEANMRTWFRDEFINSFNTQKLGGYDPYMNEYVLSTNDRQLPSNPQCIPCGVPQTFNIFTNQSEEVANYCIDLKSNVGLVTITCTVLSISAGADYTLNINYNGNTYTSGSATGDSIVDFNKDSITETAAQISIIATGNISLSVSAACPLFNNLTIYEVVLTSNSNSGETIHTEYRYTDGGFISPLQSNLVVFQSGTDPVVSRFNSVTGAVGTGSFPTDYSNVFIQTSKITPDTFNFDPYGNSFKYLRTNVEYTNDPVDITTLLSLADSTYPNSGGPLTYYAQFSMPPSGLGDKMYLIWDLRDSGISNLCFSNTGDEASLKDMCCNCAACSESCISIVVTNNSNTQDAQIYLPEGTCGNNAAATITLDPSEVQTLCINNKPYYVPKGDVSISLDACGCAPCLETCQQYTVWNNSGASATINYTSCSGTPATHTLADGDVYQVCTPIGNPIYAPVGTVHIDLSNACGCCSSNCLTWEVVNNSSTEASFNAMGCDNSMHNYTVTGLGTLSFCTRGDSAPISSNRELTFTVTSSCGCTEPYPCEYFINVNNIYPSTQQTLISTPGTLPIIFQGIDWRSQFGNGSPRWQSLNTLPSNPSATLIPGQTYIVEITLSDPFEIDINFWLGCSFSGTDTVPPDAVILGSASTMQTFTIVYNPFGTGASNFGSWYRLASTLPAGRGYNGLIIFNIKICP